MNEDEVRPRMANLVFRLSKTTDVHLYSYVTTMLCSRENNVKRGDKPAGIKNLQRLWNNTVHTS